MTRSLFLPTLVYTDLYTASVVTSSFRKERRVAGDRLRLRNRTGASGECAGVGYNGDTLSFFGLGSKRIEIAVR